MSIMLDALLRGELACLYQEAHGTLRVGDRSHRVLLPGSFNPLHHGHTSLADIVAKRLGLPVAFELSIANVDKPELSADEVTRRLKQFHGRHTVYVSRAATFREKAALFPGCLFVVGADTAERLIHPRFYGDDPAEMHRALDEIRALGCSFIVGGRVDATGRFVDLDGVVVPEAFRPMFRGLEESEFRVDVSSTRLRLKNDP
jgi:Cytidylyltransferase-like